MDLAWIKHRTDTFKPTIDTLRILCNLRWPHTSELTASKIIMKCISMTKYSIVTLIYAGEKLHIMKECLYSTDGEISDHVIVEIIMSAYIHDHKNIFDTKVATCTGIDIQPNVTYIYSEYIPFYHHTLFANRITYIPVYTSIICQIAKILCLLETRSIAHQDLKIANIAYRSSGEVVLLDFDSATVGEYTDEHEIGTITTRAPEISGLAQYNIFRAQVWSLGIIWCEMVLTKPVFDNSTQPKQLHTFVTELVECSTPRAKKLRTRISPSLYLVLLDMLRINPRDRLTMQMVYTRLHSEHKGQSSFAGNRPCRKNMS